ncbi:hypothetical protein IC582_023637 [Cucumis melo]
MFDGAIKCKQTFERLEEHGPNYLSKDDIPTAEDWDSAKVFVKFLKTFSEALICAQIWIQSKPLDDMTEEIDDAKEIDEGNILF